MARWALGNYKEGEPSQIAAGWNSSNPRPPDVTRGDNVVVEGTAHRGCCGKVRRAAAGKWRVASADPWHSAISRCHPSEVCLFGGGIHRRTPGLFSGPGKRSGL